MRMQPVATASPVEPDRGPSTTTSFVSEQNLIPAAALSAGLRDDLCDLGGLATLQDSHQREG